MPNHQTTKPDATTIAGFPLLDTDQRRRLATKLADVGITPTDAAHAAARLAVGVDSTTPDAFAPQWTPLTTPDLRAATITDPDGDADGLTSTRIVGWWPALELPLFRIGNWTPNGRDTYTRDHGATGGQDDIVWPVARIGADGVWTVRLTKQTQANPPGAHDGTGTYQWVQPRTGTGRWVVSSKGAGFPRPRPIPEGSEATLFGGGRITTTAVFVRFTTGSGKPIRSAWVALDGLSELVTARDYLRTIARRNYGMRTLEPHTSPELHELLNQVKRSNPDIPLATGVRLLHRADLSTAERLLAANPRPKRSTKGDDTADMVAAFHARIAQPTSALSRDLPNVDRYYPLGKSTTPDVLAQDLAVKWMVSPQTARKRLNKVLREGAPGVLSVTTVSVDHNRSYTNLTTYSHHRNGITIDINDYGGGQTITICRRPIDNLSTLMRSQRHGPTILVNDDQFTTWWQAQVEAIDAEHTTARETEQDQRRQEIAAAEARMSADERTAMRALEALGRTLDWNPRLHPSPTHNAEPRLHLFFNAVLSGPDAKTAYDTLIAQGWTPPQTSEEPPPN